MISVSSLAIGYLLLNLFSTSANVSGDVCGTLFGSAGMLTLGRAGHGALCAHDRCDAYAFYFVSQPDFHGIV